jgi:hypothetical protein
MKKNKEYKLSFGQRMTALKKARAWVKERLKKDKQASFDDAVPEVKGDALFGIPDKPKGIPIEATSTVPTTPVYKPSNVIEQAMERLREQTRNLKD